MGSAKWPSYSGSINGTWGTQAHDFHTGAYYRKSCARKNARWECSMRMAVVVLVQSEGKGPPALLLQHAAPSDNRLSSQDVDACGPNMPRCLAPRAQGPHGLETIGGCACYRRTVRT